jgi:hypothetical protein
MKMLSKIEILECNDIKSEVVKVPEWNGEVLVQGLTLAEKDSWADCIIVDGKADMNGATALLCALCMRDENGERLFSSDDIDALDAKSAQALDRVFQVAQRLSGIGQEEIEETVKNSEKTQTSDSD